MEQVTLAQLTQIVKSLGDEYEVKCDCLMRGPPHAPNWIANLVVKKSGQDLYYADASAPTKQEATTKAATQVATKVDEHRLEISQRRFSHSSVESNDVPVPTGTGATFAEFARSMQAAVNGSPAKFAAIKDQPKSDPRAIQKHLSQQVKDRDRRIAALKEEIDYLTSHECEPPFAVEEARAAHLFVMLAHPAVAPFAGSLTFGSLNYSTVAPALISLISGADKAAADAHNRLMHALNGNLASPAQVVLPKDLTDMPADAQVSIVMRLPVLVLKQLLLESDRTALYVKFDGQKQTFDLSVVERNMVFESELSLDTADEAAAAAHNAEMHATNGNIMFLLLLLCLVGVYAKDNTLLMWQGLNLAAATTCYSGEIAQNPHVSFPNSFEPATWMTLQVFWTHQDGRYGVVYQSDRPCSTNLTCGAVVGNYFISDEPADNVYGVALIFDNPSTNPLCIGCNSQFLFSRQHLCYYAYSGTSAMSGGGFAVYNRFNINPVEDVIISKQPTQKVLASEAAAHNSRMHALNGNMERLLALGKYIESGGRLVVNAPKSDEEGRKGLQDIAEALEELRTSKGAEPVRTETLDSDERMKLQEIAEALEALLKGVDPPDSTPTPGKELTPTPDQSETEDDSSVHTAESHIHTILRAANRRRGRGRARPIQEQILPAYVRPGNRSELFRIRATRTNKGKFFRNLARRGVHGAAAQFMLQMLDPFHDEAYSPQQCPADGNDKSLVISNPATYTISKPPDIDPEDKWDCHIVLSNLWCNKPYLPLHENQSLDDVPNGDYVTGSSFQWNPLTNEYKILLSYSANKILFSGPFPVGLMAVCVPSGERTFWDSPVGGNVNARVISIPVPTDLMRGEHRCVGAAFEVHNVSPALDKPGTVYVYRLPYEAKEGAVKGRAVSKGPGPAPGVDIEFSDALFFQDVPAEVDEVKSTMLQKQWEAKEGCYVVARPVGMPTIHRPDNAVPIRRPRNVEDFNEVGDSSVYTVGCVAIRVGGSAGTKTLEILGMVQTQHRWDLSGAYFTGLDNDTVLTIDANILVEHVPNAANDNDAIFARLARIPPAMPPRLPIELMRAFKLLPPGVKAAMNSGGGWWDLVCDVVSAASPLADAVVPGSGQVVRTVASVAKPIPKVVTQVRKVITDRKKGKVVKETISKTASAGLKSSKKGK